MTKAMDCRAPTEADKEVGRRVRQRRTEVGLSQAKLAQAIGVTFRQVQKYEGGLNRIGIGRLTQIATALDVAPNHFLGSDKERSGDPRSLLSKFLELPEAAEMMTAFVRLDDGRDRKAVVETALQMTQGVAR